MCDLACLNSTKCSADNGDCDGCVRPRVHINVADDDDADMDVYQPLVQVGDSASGEVLRPAGGSGVLRAPGIGHALYGDAFAGNSYATSRRGRATLPVGATELRRRRGAVVCAWLRPTPTRGPCLRRSVPKRYELRVADAVRVYAYCLNQTAAVACNFDNGDCTGCADGVGGDTYECVASYHTRVGNNLRYDECVSRCPWLGIGNGECEDRCLFSKVPTHNPACVARL